MKRLIECLCWIAVCTALLYVYTNYLDQRGLLVFTQALSHTFVLLLFSLSVASLVHLKTIENDEKYHLLRFFCIFTRRCAIYSFIMFLLGVALPTSTWQSSPFPGVENDPWIGISVIAGIAMAILIMSSSFIPLFSDPKNGKNTQGKILDYNH